MLKMKPRQIFNNFLTNRFFFLTFLSTHTHTNTQTHTHTHTHTHTPVNQGNLKNYFLLDNDPSILNRPDDISKYFRSLLKDDFTKVKFIHLCILFSNGT